MDKIRQYLRNPLVLFVVCLVIGLLVGIFVLGYWWFPVQWTNSGAFNLSPDLQEDWLRAAIDSYSVNQDTNLAITRYNDLGSDAPDILATVQATPAPQDPQAISAYSAVVLAQPNPPQTPNIPGNRLVNAFLLLLLILILIALVIWIVFRLLRKSNAEQEPEPVGEMFTSDESELSELDEEEDLAPPAEEEPPLAPAVAAWAAAEAFDDESQPDVEVEPLPVEEPTDEMLGKGVEPDFSEEEVSTPSQQEELAKFYYDLAYIEGIGPVYAEKLKAIGIDTPRALLEKGASARGRVDIAAASGISDKLVLKWVNHVDLYRIKGVGSEYADLLEAAGVDTVVELATRNPANLYQRLVSTNMEKRLVRKVPFPSQVESWIEQAKNLPRIITY
jgi:predicted flap endonuclease-1-like 5' DNA nuclease